MSERSSLSDPCPAWCDPEWCITDHNGRDHQSAPSVLTVLEGSVSVRVHGGDDSDPEFGLTVASRADVQHCGSCGSSYRPTVELVVTGDELDKLALLLPTQRAATGQQSVLGGVA